MNYIKKLYSGRISRKNYGLGLLFFIGSFISFILLITIVPSMLLLYDNYYFWGFVMIVLYAVFVIHIFSLHVRRFHDLGGNGWRVFLFLIPLVNLMTLIYLLAAEGGRETNQYGEVSSKSIKFFDAIFNSNQKDIN